MSTNNTESIVLVIEAKGEIISSNFAEFAIMVRSRLEEINRDLATDDDFDQADADAKAIAGAEAELKAAKEKALGDAEALNLLFTQIDSLSGDLAAARLDLTKQIAKRKEEVKSDIVIEALEKIDMDPIVRRRAFLEGLQSAIKGKRTIDTMRKAVGVQLTCYLATIAKTEAVLVRYESAYGPDSLPDRRELAVQNSQYVEQELRRRIDLRRANEEKAKAEADAKAAREATAKAQAELAEANKPPLPPTQALVSAPVTRGREDDSLFDAPRAAVAAPAANLPSQAALEEREDFKAVCKAAFGKIKDCRESMTDPANTAAVKAFGDAVNAGWQALLATWKEPNQ